MHGVAGRDLDVAQGFGHGRQIGESEDIHFEQADFGQRGAFIGGHQRVFVFGSTLEWYYFVEGIAANHHATGMGADVAHAPFDALGPIDDLFGFVARFVELFEFGGFFQRIAQGDIGRIGDEFGDAVDFRQRHIEGATHVTDGRFGAQCAVRDDLGGIFTAIFGGNIIEDLATAGISKVDVDIGHLEPFGAQKTLKQQFVGDRVDVGNA